MTYGPSTLQDRVDDGTFPATTRVLPLDGGTLGNASFLAVPANASHAAGAMVVADLALAPEQQARQGRTRRVGPVHGARPRRLPTGRRGRLRRRYTGGEVVPSFAELSPRRPARSSPAGWVAPLEDTWRAQVLRLGEGARASAAADCRPWSPRWRCSAAGLVAAGRRASGWPRWSARPGDPRRLPRGSRPAPSLSESLVLSLSLAAVSTAIALVRGLRRGGAGHGAPGSGAGCWRARGVATVPVPHLVGATAIGLLLADSVSSHGCPSGTSDGSSRRWSPGRGGSRWSPSTPGRSRRSSRSSSSARCGGRRARWTRPPPPSARAARPAASRHPAAGRRRRSSRPAASRSPTSSAPTRCLAARAHLSGAAAGAGLPPVHRHRPRHPTRGGGGGGRDHRPERRRRWSAPRSCCAASRGPHERRGPPGRALVASYRPMRRPRRSRRRGSCCLSCPLVLWAAGRSLDLPGAAPGRWGFTGWAAAAGPGRRAGDAALGGPGDDGRGARHPGRRRRRAGSWLCTGSPVVGSSRRRCCCPSRCRRSPS